MSFTTLTAVNFVFVRIETRDGLVGWGEAACLGGPDLERGIGGVDRGHAASATSRPGSSGATPPQIEALRLEMAQAGAGQPVRARRRRDGAVGPQRPRARRARPSPARRPRARPRAAVVVAGRGAAATPRWPRRARRSRAGTASSRSRRRRIRSPRTSRACGPSARPSAPTVRLRVDANQGWDRPTALRAIRAMEPYDLDFVEQPVPRWDLDGLAEIARSVTRADHGRRVVRLAAGRAGHRAARRRVDPRRSSSRSRPAWPRPWPSPASPRRPVSAATSAA